MKNSVLRNTKAWRLFWLVTAYPKAILSVGVAIVLLAASFLPKLVKDTTSDAFIPDDHPALIYRDKVKKIFGLEDPMVIVVVNNGDKGVFNPKTLKLVQRITEAVSKVDNVDPDRITSLATENNIVGDKDGMKVKSFFDDPPETQATADKIRLAVMDFPLYLGSLVARDGKATLIVLELLDQTKAQEVYKKLRLLLANVKKENGEEIVIAGEGAVSGYMGAYIDADAQKLNPIAALVITLVLFIAFRTLRGTLLPNLIVLATVASALGVMAASGVSFFVITNALPVVLIGIAVADSIHILSQYYEEMARHSQENAREIVVRSMCAMWRPVSLTSITTIAGFLGLSLASIMPPMKYFGLFAMVGVTTAWIYSLTVLPAALSLLKLKPGKSYSSKRMQKLEIAKSTSAEFGFDGFARMMRSFGRTVNKYYISVLVLGLVIAIVGLYGAFKLELNEERINTFHPKEPIYQADKIINERFDGVNYLDIVIETPAKEDIFRPVNLRRIESLQRYVKSLPHVNGSTSIVDYLKQMNRALNENKKQFYTLPTKTDLVAQYFLLYSASGDPTDFEEEVDYDYRLANIRVRLDTGRYSVAKTVVESVQRYIDSQFNTSMIKASLSGRVNVDYHWIKRLGDSHFGSVAIALLLVWLVASISLRSIVAGVITIIPVLMSILIIYAVMGFTNIWLAIGTSMFAAISIGLGVDFSVHAIERLKVLLTEEKRPFDESIELLFATTGRALFFNLAALALGFGVLISSDVVPLVRFGSLVAVAVSVSFISSMTLLPALVKWIRPAFLKIEDNRCNSKSPTSRALEAND